MFNFFFFFLQSTNGSFSSPIISVQFTEQNDCYVLVCLQFNSVKKTIEADYCNLEQTISKYPRFEENKVIAVNS